MISRKKEVSILVIEDNPFHAKYIKDMVKSYGGKTFHATDGYEAFSLLRAHNIDLVVLDWNLPTFRGEQILSVLDHLLKPIRYKRKELVPFIVYTSEVPEDIELPHLRHLQIFDFWQKGDSLIHLNKRISAILQTLNKKENLYAV